MSSFLIWSGALASLYAVVAIPYGFYLKPISGKNPKVSEQKHNGSGDNVAGDKTTMQKKELSVKNSPFSINTIDQQGSNQINIGTQQRNITQDTISKLNAILPRNKNQVVEVNSIDGDAEAFRFANQIKVHLESLGHTVTGVSKRIYAKDWVSTNIITNEDGSVKEIIVGRQP